MIELAKDLMSRNDWLILDTETTGLDTQAQACQIGILASTGKALLDTLVKPTFKIPAQATTIHGITNDMVTNQPTMQDVLPYLREFLTGKTIVVYNAPYDRAIIRQSLIAWYMEDYLGYHPEIWQWFHNLTWLDVMNPYAEYWGDWNEYYESYIWQKLTNACRQQGIPINGAHSAIGDCQMTLALIKTIAGKSS